MSEHTPTPYDFIPDLASGNTKIWADRECLGIIYQQGYPDSSAENADFIVRACNSHDDLLAALELAEWGTEGLCGACDHPAKHQHQPECPVARAIAKAKGE